MFGRRRTYLLFISSFLSITLIILIYNSIKWKRKIVPVTDEKIEFINFQDYYPDMTEISDLSNETQLFPLDYQNSNLIASNEHSNDDIPTPVSGNLNLQMGEEKTDTVKTLNATSDLSIQPTTDNSYSKQLYSINKYLIESPNICRNVEGEFLLFICVHSSIDNEARRSVVRRTWGQSEFMRRLNYRIAFFIGANRIGSLAIEAQRAIEVEAEKYGDIVQIDFEDAYRNLTYKAITVLQWVVKNCNQPQFILKADDDIFINIYAVVNRLEKTKTSYDPMEDFFMCYVHLGFATEVLREGKWKVTREEYPGDSYPDYCAGAAYITRPRTIRRLVAAAYQVPYFWIDDVYVTGILPEYIGNISHVNIGEFYYLDNDVLENSFFHNENPEITIYFVHVPAVEEEKIIEIFRNLTEPVVPG